MPLLIIIAILIVYGIIYLKEKLEPADEYDLNMTEQEKIAKCLSNNKKQIEKLIRKYK